MVDHAQQTSRGEIVSAKLNAKKCKDVNKDNSLNHFTFSVLFVIYKREEVEITHEPSWYDKEQLPSLTSTHLIFFDEVHIQQYSEPPVTSRLKKHNIRFPRDEEGDIDVKTVNMTRTINQTRPPSGMKKREGSALM